MFGTKKKNHPMQKGPAQLALNTSNNSAVERSVKATLAAVRSTYSCRRACRVTSE